MKIALLLLIMPLFRLTTKPPIDETIILYRIESFMTLKKKIMEKAWPQTADSAYDIPLIYYTDSVCYVANPGEKFITMGRPELKYENGNLRIYKTKSRMDDIPWHMETHLSDVETDYNYLVPYAKVTGLEEARKEARKYEKDITLEAWYGMILHELFHGYQFRHQGYWQYADKSNFKYRVINDSLQSYYTNLDWYKKGIDQENALILQAIEEKDLAKKKDLTRKMLELRNERRKKIDRPVAFYETGFEAMEGTARYLEDATIMKMEKSMIAGKLIALDSNYNRLQPVKSKQVSEIAFKTEESQSYTYAIGFNMCRLLDTFNSDYKSRLFKIPELTLEKILQEIVH
jgi:hypothetical protein